MVYFARKVRAAVVSVVLVCSTLLIPAVPIANQLTATAHAQTTGPLIQFNSYSNNDPIQGLAAGNDDPLLSWGDTQVIWRAKSIPNTSTRGAFPEVGSGSPPPYAIAYFERNVNDANVTAADGYVMHSLVLTNIDTAHSNSFTFYCGTQTLSGTLGAVGSGTETRLLETSDFVAAGMTGTCNTTDAPMGEIALASDNIGSVGIEQLSFSWKNYGWPSLGVRYNDPPESYTLGPNQAYFFPYYANTSEEVNQFNILLSNTKLNTSDTSATYEFGLYDDSGSGGGPGQIQNWCYTEVPFTSSPTWFYCNVSAPSQESWVYGGHKYWIGVMDTSVHNFGIASAYTTQIYGEAPVAGFLNSKVGSSTSIHDLPPTNPSIDTFGDPSVGRHIEMYMGNADYPFIGDTNPGTGVTNISVGGQPTGTTVPPISYTQQFYAQDDGDYNTVGAYFQAGDSNSAPVIGLASDSSGMPGAWLAYCSPGSGVQSFGWHSCRITDQYLTNGTSYWLVFMETGNVTTPTQMTCANYDNAWACNNYMWGAGTSKLAGTINNSGQLIGNSNGGNSQTTIVVDGRQPSNSSHINVSEQFTAASSATINQIYAYATTPSNGLNLMELGIAADSSNTTGSTLANCNTPSTGPGAPANPGVFAWESCTLNTAVSLVANTKYWLYGKATPDINVNNYTNGRAIKCANYDSGTNCANQMGGAGIQTRDWFFGPQQPVWSTPNSNWGNLLIYGAGAVTTWTWQAPTSTSSNLLIYADHETYNDVMYGVDATEANATDLAVATPTPVPSTDPQAEVHVGPIPKAVQQAVPPARYPKGFETTAEPAQPETVHHALTDPPGGWPLPKLSKLSKGVPSSLPHPALAAPKSATQKVSDKYVLPKVTKPVTVNNGPTAPQAPHLGR
jgi:hypothetical protein